RQKKTPAAFVKAAGKGRCFGNWVGVGGRSGGAALAGKKPENGSFQAAWWSCARRCNVSHSRRQQSRSRSMVSVSRWTASASSVQVSCLWQARRCPSKSLSHNKLLSRWLIPEPPQQCCFALAGTAQVNCKARATRHEQS